MSLLKLVFGMTCAQLYQGPTEQHMKYLATFAGMCFSAGDRSNSSGVNSKVRVRVTYIRCEREKDTFRVSVAVTLP